MGGLLLLSWLVVASTEGSFWSSVTSFFSSTDSSGKTATVASHEEVRKEVDAEGKETVTIKRQVSHSSDDERGDEEASLAPEDDGVGTCTNPGECQQEQGGSDLHIPSAEERLEAQREKQAAAPDSVAEKARKLREEQEARTAAAMQSAKSAAAAAEKEQRAKAEAAQKAALDYAEEARRKQLEVMEKAKQQQLEARRKQEALQQQRLEMQKAAAAAAGNQAAMAALAKAKQQAFVDAARHDHLKQPAIPPAMAGAQKAAVPAAQPAPAAGGTDCDNFPVQKDVEPLDVAVKHVSGSACCAPSKDPSPSTQSGCCQRCTASAECQVFVWQPSSGTCWLLKWKDTEQKMMTAKDRVTGFKVAPV